MNISNNAVPGMSIVETSVDALRLRNPRLLEEAIRVLHLLGPCFLPLLQEFADSGLETTHRRKLQQVIDFPPQAPLSGNLEESVIALLRLSLEHGDEQLIVLAARAARQNCPELGRTILHDALSCTRKSQRIRYLRAVELVGIAASDIKSIFLLDHIAATTVGPLGRLAWNIARGIFRGSACVEQESGEDGA